jgi:hypothetical protein
MQRESIKNRFFVVIKMDITDFRINGLNITSWHKRDFLRFLNKFYKTKIRNIYP